LKKHSCILTVLALSILGLFTAVAMVQGRSWTTLTGSTENGDNSTGGGGGGGGDVASPALDVGQ